MKKTWVLLLVLNLFLLTGCKTKTPPIVIDDCDYTFSFTEGDLIPMEKISSTNSTIIGDIDNFIHVCKPKHVNPIIFKDPIARTITVQIDFEHIFPIDSLELSAYTGSKAEAIKTISIGYSLNGIQFQKL